MGMGWEGMGIEKMGMGGNGNVESHSRTSLLWICKPKFFGIREPSLCGQRHPGIAFQLLLLRLKAGVT